MTMMINGKSLALWSCLGLMLGVGVWFVATKTGGGTADAAVPTQEEQEKFVADILRLCDMNHPEESCIAQLCPQLTTNMTDFNSPLPCPHSDGTYTVFDLVGGGDDVEGCFVDGTSRLLAEKYDHHSMGSNGGACDAQLNWIWCYENYDRCYWDTKENKCALKASAAAEVPPSLPESAPNATTYIIDEQDDMESRALWATRETYGDSSYCTWSWWSGKKCVKCYDSPRGWYDRDGPAYNCAWYSRGDRCSNFGNGYRRLGRTANQVCCACGGGSRGGSNSPSPSPIPPTVSPTHASNSPTPSPTPPTVPPTHSPTVNPTPSPTPPTMSPTHSPTVNPTPSPTPPTVVPTPAPTVSGIRTDGVVDAFKVASRFCQERGTPPSEVLQPYHTTGRANSCGEDCSDQTNPIYHGYDLNHPNIPGYPFLVDGYTPTWVKRIVKNDKPLSQVTWLYDKTCSESNQNTATNMGMLKRPRVVACTNKETGEPSLDQTACARIYFHEHVHGGFHQVENYIGNKESTRTGWFHQNFFTNPYSIMAGPNAAVASSGKIHFASVETIKTNEPPCAVGETAGDCFDDSTRSGVAFPEPPTPFKNPQNQTAKLYEQLRSAIATCPDPFSEDGTYREETNWDLGGTIPNPRDRSEILDSDDQRLRELNVALFGELTRFGPSMIEGASDKVQLTLVGELAAALSMCLNPSSLEYSPEICKLRTLALGHKWNRSDEAAAREGYHEGKKYEFSIPDEDGRSVTETQSECLHYTDDIANIVIQSQRCVYVDDADGNRMEKVIAEKVWPSDWDWSNPKAPGRQRDKVWVKLDNELCKAQELEYGTCKNTTDCRNFMGWTQQEKTEYFSTSAATVNLACEEGRCKGFVPGDCDDLGDVESTCEHACGVPCGYFQLPINRDIMTYRASVNLDPNAREIGRNLAIHAGSNVVKFNRNKELVVYFEGAAEYVIHEKPNWDSDGKMIPPSYVANLYIGNPSPVMHPHTVADINKKLRRDILDSDASRTLWNALQLSQQGEITEDEVQTWNRRVWKRYGAEYQRHASIFGLNADTISEPDDLGFMQTFSINSALQKIATARQDWTEINDRGDIVLAPLTPAMLPPLLNPYYESPEEDGRGAKVKGLALYPFSVVAKGEVFVNTMSWHYFNLYKDGGYNEASGNPDGAGCGHVDHSRFWDDEGITSDPEVVRHIFNGYRDLRNDPSSQLANHDRNIAVGDKDFEGQIFHQSPLHENTFKAVDSLLGTMESAGRFLRADTVGSHFFDLLEHVTWVHQLSEYSPDVRLHMLVSHEYWNAGLGENREKCVFDIESECHGDDSAPWEVGGETYMCNDFYPDRCDREGKAINADNQCCVCELRKWVREAEATQFAAMWTREYKGILDEASGVWKCCHVEWSIVGASCDEKAEYVACSIDQHPNPTSYDHAQLRCGFVEDHCAKLKDSDHMSGTKCTEGFACCMAEHGCASNCLMGTNVIGCSFKPLNTQLFEEAIRMWFARGAEATSVFYGNIENWNTVHVTSMNRLYYGKESFNADLSKWDTSNVQGMTQVCHITHNSIRNANQ